MSLLFCPAPFLRVVYALENQINKHYVNDAPEAKRWELAMSRITKGATYRIVIATAAIVVASVGLSFYYAHHRHPLSGECDALIEQLCE